MAVGRAMLKLLVTGGKILHKKNHRAHCFQGCLAWTPPKVWLVLVGASWVSNSWQYLFETDEVQIISSPDNALLYNLCFPTIV